MGFCVTALAISFRIARTSAHNLLIARARASVRLQHIAIHPNGSGTDFSDRGGPHRSADEPLDFLGASVNLSFRNVALFSLHVEYGSINTR